MGRDYYHPLWVGWWSIMTPTCDGMTQLVQPPKMRFMEDSFVRIEYSQFSGSPHFSHTKITHENFKKRYENVRNVGMTDTFLTRTKILRKMWSQTWDFRYPECHFCLLLRLGQIVSALPWPPLLTTSGGLKLVARLIAVLPGVEYQKMQHPNPSKKQGPVILREKKVASKLSQ